MDWTPLDDLFRASVDRGELAGAVVRVWGPGGCHEHRAAIGSADVASGRPMTQDAIFRLYSMTKPITAAAMMVLWDEGLWSPDDPLAEHLPELEGLTVLDASGGTVAATRSPTVEELMTNRAGFTYGLTTDDVDVRFRDAGVPSFPRSIAPADYLARLARAPLAFQPGEGWRYGAGMDVQGLLVGRLSGMPFADFAAERLFAPLGMRDTGFALPVADEGRLASLYVPFGDSLVELPTSDVSPDFRVDASMASGGAGLLSTAEDYARFGRMLLGGGCLDDRRVLSSAAVARMTSGRTPSHLLTGANGTSPHWLRPGYEYAYNGIAVTDPVIADVPLGGGTYLWDGAAGSWFWVDPENGLVVVCMVQLLADAGHLSLQFRSRRIVAGILAGSPMGEAA